MKLLPLPRTHHLLLAGVTLVLCACTHRVVFTSKPEGASVTINKQFVGKTPCRVELEQPNAFSQFAYEVSLPNYVTQAGFLEKETRWGWVALDIVTIYGIALLPFNTTKPLDAFHYVLTPEHGAGSQTAVPSPSAPAQMPPIAKVANESAMPLVSKPAPKPVVADDTVLDDNEVDTTDQKIIDSVREFFAAEWMTSIAGKAKPVIIVQYFTVNEEDRQFKDRLGLVARQARETWESAAIQQNKGRFRFITPDKQIARAERKEQDQYATEETRKDNFAEAGSDYVVYGKINRKSRADVAELRYTIELRLVDVKAQEMLWSKTLSFIAR